MVVRGTPSCHVVPVYLISNTNTYSSHPSHSDKRIEATGCTNTETDQTSQIPHESRKKKKMSSQVSADGDPAMEKYYDALPSTGDSQFSHTTYMITSSHTKENPPPYATSTVHSKTAQDNVQTTTTPKHRAHKKDAWRVVRTRVSTLPKDGATPGHPYISRLYMDFITPVSGSIKTAAQQDCRRLASCANACLPKGIQHHRPLQNPPEIFSYLDSSGHRVPCSITQGIGPDEVEHLFHGPYDWTRDWDWRLTAKFNPGKGTDWFMLVHIYFDNLPDLLCKTVPWSDAQRLTASLPFRAPYGWDEEKPEYEWHRTWRLCEPVDDPRWGASIIACHKEYTSSSTAESPWDLATSDILTG